MKILVYGLNFVPELTGIGKYTGDMAQWLARQGHEVRVVTAPPYYPDWKVGQGYANRWCREQVPVSTGSAQGTTFLVYRCPLWVPGKPGGLKRLLHLASFALLSLPLMLRQALWRPDVVWVVAPAFFCLPGAWLTGRLAGAPLWAHIQDFEVDAAFDLGLLKGEGLRRSVSGLESWLLRRFDVVSTISRRMLERLLMKGVDKDKAVLFPNWVDIAAISPLSSPSAYRRELGIAEDALVALYSGNMGAKQGLEILPQVARRLVAHKDLIFVFCGEGVGRTELAAQCADLSNVRLLPLQPLERLGDLLGLADIHLMPQRGDAADLVMPSKLTGMLASGRPVVAGARPGTELAGVVAQCGVSVEPDSAVAFAAGVEGLLLDPGLRQRFGKAARQYAEEHLAKDAVLERFERELQTRFIRPGHLA